MADDGQLLAYHLVVMVQHQVPVMFRLVNYLDNSFKDTYNNLKEVY